MHVISFLFLLTLSFSSSTLDPSQASQPDLEAANLTNDPQVFIHHALQVRQRLGKSVMLTYDGLKMVDHVASTLTDFDPEMVKQAFFGVKNLAENKPYQFVIVLGAVGGGAVYGPKLLKYLDGTFKKAANLPMRQKLVLYQSLMFIRLFVGATIPATSPIFTTTIQLIEANSSTDHTMLLTTTLAVLPNLLARSQRFSEFMWKHLSKNKLLGELMSDVMMKAFNAGMSDEEKAGNAIALGHFTPGSGTFPSLVAGIFVPSMIDLALSGELGISDDLFVNVGVKSFKDARGALVDARLLLVCAQLFKVIFSLCDSKWNDAFMHALNFLIIQSIILMIDAKEDEKVQPYVPVGIIFLSAVLLPWTERYIARKTGACCTRNQSPRDISENFIETEVGPEVQP